MPGHRWQRLTQAGLLALLLGVSPWQTLSTLLPGPARPSAGAGVPRALAAAAAPTLASPPAGATLTDFGPTLTWTNPASAAQVHLQVLPANNDGPAIDLLLGSPVTSYKVAAPPEWYGLLPGMSYTWRVRVSDATTSVPLDDPSWSPWAERKFRTPAVTAATVTLAAPVNGGFATTMTPTLTWANSRPDVFYYEFQLSKDQTFTTDPSRAIAMVYEALLHGGVTTPPNSYVVPKDFPLEPNSVYYWRVRPRIQGDGTPTPWGPANIFRTVTPNPQVLYAGLKEGATQGSDLIVANADGSNVRNLTAGRFGDDRSPSWSPNRRQIVFESGRDNESEAVYIMNADGSGERRLSPPGQRAFNPVWSPDGEKIAFELETGPSGADIVVVRADGSGLVNVSSNPAAAETQPGWSPNSTHLVYTQQVNENDSALYVVAADGSGKRKLTAASGVHEDMASWSPDGSRVAYSFANRTTQSHELYIINADGSTPRSIARGLIADWPVQWSPDGGARLLYVAGSGSGEGSRAVWVVNADGSTPRNLSGNNQWVEDNPFWSPDGTKISFTSNRADFEGAGGYHLYIMNADGAGKVRAGDFTTSAHVRDAGIWPPM